MEHDESDATHSHTPASPSRCVIINADDFGRTDGINRGIIEAHENGIVTSASLMVAYPAAEGAAAYARNHPALSVGLHFDLYEWRYRDGEWEAVYERVDPQDPEAVRAELRRQAEIFQQLIGRTPTHVDSHQHAHMEEPCRSAVLAYGQRLDVAVRACDPRVAFSGGFYGQSNQGEPFPEGITPEQLITTLNALPPGWTELGCHPGYTGDWETDYGVEREQERRTLCDPRVRAALAGAGISLRSFHHFNRPAVSA